MEELIEMYRNTLLSKDFRADKKLLERHNVSESQWKNFLNLVRDLELNEDGARIMLDEISTGRVVLK